MATNYKFDPAKYSRARLLKKKDRAKTTEMISPDTDLEMLLQSASENASGTKYGCQTEQGSVPVPPMTARTSRILTVTNHSAAQPIGANNELLGEQKTARRCCVARFDAAISSSEGLVARDGTKSGASSRRRLFWQGLAIFVVESERHELAFAVRPFERRRKSRRRNAA